MVLLLLAPYNDSMQLGQGFNSFLHMPCINGAVDIPQDSLRTQATRSGGSSNVSQVVSYSSRFVEKISEVVRSMNISAASSIKSGTIEVSGNSLTVDEAKFAASDLNAVISVKVINQTISSHENPKFVPLDGVKMNSRKFFEIFGDCYVSGFMEGGDLHGIVSVKVLDQSKTTEVETALKGQMNGTGNSGDFILGEGTGSSNFSAALSQTETSVTVSWSGGGQIKPDEQEWTLDSLVKTASCFSSRVANCPQRTWAILTRYDNNRSFVEWADQHDIVVPDFARVQQVTSDLLDSFMEYKNNLSRLNAIMSNPAGFKLSPYKNPVQLNVEALVAERKLLKDEMSKISYIIDHLNKDPTQPAPFEIKNPIIWACRLPVPVDAPAIDGSTFTPADKVAIIAGFPFEPVEEVAAQPAPITPAADLEQATKAAMDSVAKQTTTMTEELKSSPLAPPPLANLANSEVYSTLNDAEKAWVSAEGNKSSYSDLRFGRHAGHDGGGPFNDAAELKKPMVPVTWPQKIELQMIAWGGHNILRLAQVHYDQLSLEHGSHGDVADSMVLNLGSGEKVDRIILGKGPLTWGVEGVAFVKLFTSSGQVQSIGDEGIAVDVFESQPYDGCEGLKGWWGASGDVLDKLGPVWGH